MQQVRTQTLKLSSITKIPSERSRSKFKLWDTKIGKNETKRVDIFKVNLDDLRPWISSKIADILNKKDDAAVEFVFKKLKEEKFFCLEKF